MQIETHIELKPDGSAVITERLRFSRRLLAYRDRAGKDLDVARLLTREAALKRMASMGDATKLAKHEVKNLPNGDRESIATFTVADINTFQYVSPWLGYADYPANNVVKCVLKPAYKSHHYNLRRAGDMYVNFIHTKPARKERGKGKDLPLPTGRSPLEMQAYRNLGPLFRDAMKGFHVRLTFESYAPIRKSKLGRRTRKQIDVINFSWRDRDTHDLPFLENEEALLDLVRWDFTSGDIGSQVAGAPANRTVPVFVATAASRWDIPFAPSRYFFDKYFKGKKLDYSEWKPSPPEKHVPARFEKIGWKGE
jgi:hypothetical protein